MRSFAAALLLVATTSLANGARANESPDRVAPLAPREASVAIRLSPLALLLSRLSAEVGVSLGARYELVASPHLTLPRNRPLTAGNGFGFAGPASVGAGGELGVRRREASGFFYGPSIVVDVTRPMPHADTFAAYGAAIDAGYTRAWDGGLSIAVGGGVLAIASERTGVAFAPRALAAIGYAF